MKKYKTVIIVVIILIAAVIFGRSVFVKGSPPQDPIPQEEILKIEITPAFYDLGKVPMKGGLAVREYDIKNGSSKSLIVKKIVTSCMCTKAGIKLDGKSTYFFSMEMSGDKNPRINFEIPAGETAKLETRFDPAAHGIQGTGPFDRVVWITFADPIGIKEVKFVGEVILQ